MNNFEDDVNTARLSIKLVAADIKRILNDQKGKTFVPPSDTGEIMANLTLSYRHLEDASMRLGKVLQAHDGGVSVYDKKTTVGA